MQKIIPHLWFADRAKQAAELYTSLFPNSQIARTYTLKNTPSGDTEVVSFKLFGYEIISISAGPYFKLNPSISFMVNFDPAADPKAHENIETVWKALSDGGRVLMPFDKYPFSEKYGWIEDKYGLSWQLILSDPAGEKRPPIIPSFLFVGDVYGKAEEATNFYMSVFEKANRGALVKYPAGMEPDKEGATMYTDFMLENQWFVAMDSAREHEFSFSEAFSFMITCVDQAEIDYYWEKLYAVPASEQCGWVKDKFGVSWQITPRDLEDMLAEGTDAQVEQVTQAFLPMKKLDIKKIKEAYDNAGS